MATGASGSGSWRASAGIAAFAAGLVSCGGAQPPSAPAAHAGAAPRASKPVAVVTPSRLLPDLAGDRGVVTSRDGERLILVDRMRAVTREDGSLARAAELFPPGRVEAVPLAARLGGGYAFFLSGPGGTQVWRSADWLGRLTPLVQLSYVASELVPGFDRLYVRIQSTNKLFAFDARTGAALPIGPMPPTASGGYGPLVVVDGWRAVVDADLRGPLATFDAGRTWRSLDIRERVLAASSTSSPFGDPPAAGDPVLSVVGGSYLVDGRGEVTFRPSEAVVGHDEPERTRTAGPAGHRPLRAALEDGWPDSPSSAVVARAGALVRVALRTGAVLDTLPDAFEGSDASCHAIRLGIGSGNFGFVCGAKAAPTTIHAFVPPLGMRPVARFATPRFVAASGNGALVIRGPCDDGAPSSGAGRTYCIIAPDGTRREVVVRAQDARDLGTERVVALADGRTVILVPPHGGLPGQLTVVGDRVAPPVTLRLPKAPRDVAQAVERGLWLDGLEERTPGELSGWVEAGGPVVGIRVTLDGVVRAGDLREPGSGGALLSGRFGLVIGSGGRASESIDGGLTWRELTLPEREVEAGRSSTRACGPAGCIVAGWLRVGWGPPAVEGDLAVAETPGSPYTATRRPSAVALVCEPTQKPPATPSFSAPSKAPARSAPRSVALKKAPWAPLRDASPPTLGSDEVGFDNGTTTDTVAMRAYAWGKKGADWTRTGRFVVRFDDRFDAAGVRSSATTASPWADEVAALEGVGSPQTFSASWGAFLDPSGLAALVRACRGAACNLFAVAQGQPPLQLRDAQGRANALPSPVAFGATRVGETWYFLSLAPGTVDALALWRVEQGVARIVTTYPRLRGAVGGSVAEPPRLVRRAQGGGLGLMFAGQPDPSERIGTWYVLPIDLEGGRAGDPIALGRRDLGGSTPPPCAPHADGWLVDSPIDGLPNVTLTEGRATLGQVEMRLVLEAGGACVVGWAATIDGLYLADGAAVQKRPAGPTAPLVATERSTGRRWTLRCGRPDG